MSRLRNGKPTRVSINIFKLRQLASRMNDDEFGFFTLKALKELNNGILSEEVKPFVKESEHKFFNGNQ